MANGNSHRWQPQLIHRRAGAASKRPAGESPSVRTVAMAVRLLRHHLGTEALQFEPANAIKSDSHPQYQRWPQNQHGSRARRPANQFICWPVGNAVNFSDCQTAAAAAAGNRLRTMDYGLLTPDYGPCQERKQGEPKPEPEPQSESQSVLLACLSAVLDINLWVAIFTFDCGRPQNNDRKLSRSRRVGRHPKQFHSAVIPIRLPTLWHLQHPAASGDRRPWILQLQSN